MFGSNDSLHLKSNRIASGLASELRKQDGVPCRTPVLPREKRVPVIRSLPTRLTLYDQKPQTPPICIPNSNNSPLRQN